MENKVELIGYYGNDIIHAQSAWCSTNRELTEIKLKRIDKLLKTLAELGHHTPFEKSSLHFLVTGEIASHIHCLKHRIGVSINTESARYKELKDDKYYVPIDWGINEQKYLNQHCLESFQKYHNCLNRLIEQGMDKKRAKESARFYLAYATQLTFDIMFNWRSFYHFLNLRNKPDAQLEIREISQKMLNLVKNIEEEPFKHTIKAFNL
ncbi:MAG: FAD-dependent thymidylate synthase [Nanoarchaeota archaeon]